MKRLYYIIFLLAVTTLLSGGEQINSFIDNYYDALSLKGDIERPYMNYRSFSSLNWDIPANLEHPWQDSLNAKTPFWENKTGSSAFYWEDSTIFQSYSLNTPYEMNDRGLWQGKGYNMAVSNGISFSSPWFEAVILPEVYFSQNLDFLIRPASGSSGSEYGYYMSHIDLPQRFGNTSFWDFSWGQTQIRGRYNNWSVGFGTQNVWLGPAEDTAIMWSNNADGFPHIDLGMDKTTTDAGDLEFKMWWGWLKSSDYFESDPDEWQSFLSGVSFSYAPSFIPGLTMGVHKTSQVDLEWFSWYSVFAAIDPGFAGFSSTGDDIDTSSGRADGRASVTWSWMFPDAGFEFYGEFGKEDYSSLLFYFIDPGHAASYVLGAKQIIPVRTQKDRFFLFRAEFATNKWSKDYYINNLSWGGGYYRHNLTYIGYTNDGQCLGAGMGPGANRQILELDYYAPFGRAGFYVLRESLDDTIVFHPDFFDSYSQSNLPVRLSGGFSGTWLAWNGFSLDSVLAYVQDFNWGLDKDEDYSGLYTNLSLSYRY